MVSHQKKSGIKMPLCLGLCISRFMKGKHLQGADKQMVTEALCVDLAAHGSEVPQLFQESVGLV